MANATIRRGQILYRVHCYPIRPSYILAAILPCPVTAQLTVMGAFKLPDAYHVNNGCSLIAIT